MKNALFLPVIAFVAALFTSCGPAAEDREKMHERAKIFQDSIARYIRMSMEEAAAPGPARVQPAMVNPGAPAATPLPAANNNSSVQGAQPGTAPAPKK